MEYRIQSTGEVKNQGEVRRMHSNTSLPKVWDANVCTALGIDPVLAAPKPETTGYTQAVRNGATQDAKGNWYLFDSERGIVSGNDPYLLLNSTAAEVTGTDYIDPLAAGLTLTAAGSSTINVSGGEYIYIAIAAA